jgi:hypothetical protein
MVLLRELEGTGISDIPNSITEAPVSEPEVSTMSDAEVKATANWILSVAKAGVDAGSDAYSDYQEHVEPYRESFLEQQSVITDCLALRMSDLEIYEHFIKEVYNKYDIPFGKWELILSSNWSNFQNRVNAINEMKVQLRYLTIQENGNINQEQYDRCKLLLSKGMEGYQGAKFQEVYEQSTTPSIVLEREVIDHIENWWSSKGWIFKLALGAGVVIVSIFVMFIFYNFIKSYGTEKGKVLANK